MAKPDFSTVDAYLAAQPPAARAVLAQVRAAIRRAVPGAAEVISYQMPTFKLHGTAVLYLAGWKAHYSLYPVSQELAAAFGKALARYEVNDKGTIRFPLDEPVPVKLIERIARLRARIVVMAQKPKAAGRSAKAAPKRRAVAE